MPSLKRGCRVAASFADSRTANETRISPIEHAVLACGMRRTRCAAILVVGLPASTIHRIECAQVGTAWGECYAADCVFRLWLVGHRAGIWPGRSERQDPAGYDRGAGPGRGRAWAQREAFDQGRNLPR